MDEVNWSSLHKILSDTTRRSILELLSEKQALSYTEIITLLRITNTGRLNYHLKALGNLVSKDEGEYRLTERGQLAVNLLRTFPERAPSEKKPSALKVATAIVLILIGVSIIASISLSAIALSGPTYVSGDRQLSISSQTIRQNATVPLTSWNVLGTPFSISWSASGPVYIYVLNQTQDDALLLQHPAAGGEAVSNFTGAPTSWVDRYYNQEANTTLSLPQGEYYFFAGSNAQAVLNTFSYGQSSQPQQAGSSSVSPLFYLSLSVFMAIGALLIVLAFSILTRRVWR
jgi:hypothetical protein